MKVFRLMLLAAPLLLFAACSDDEGVNPPIDTTDTEKPVVTIITPLPDQEIAGSDLLVEVTATDNRKVTKVELYLSTNPFPAATLTAPPWTTTLDISTLAPGPHAISAKAFDSTGNESNRSTVTFVVKEEERFTFTFTPGAEYTYDRWDLDAGSNPVASSLRSYVSRFENGDGSSKGGQTDWFRMISTDNRSGRSDTLISRADAQGNVQVYGLANALVSRFTRELVDNGTLPEPPVLPAPEWTYLALVNDANVDEYEPGNEWAITTGSGIDISFGLVSATITMRGTYLEKGEIFTVQGKDITTWKVRIIVNISILGQNNEIPVYIWFSDDPSAQIQLRQESTELNLGLITFPVEGDMQKLVSWQ